MQLLAPWPRICCLQSPHQANSCLGNYLLDECWGDSECVQFCDSRSCKGKLMTGGGGRSETARQKIDVQKAFVNRHVSEFLTIWDRDIWQPLHLCCVL